MVFEILAISIFFHKYNLFIARQSKANKIFYLFFEVPTHMFHFLKYFPLGKNNGKKSYSISKIFHANFSSFEM